MMKRIVLSFSLLLLAVSLFAQVNPEMAHKEAFERAKKGNYDEALDLLQKALASSPNETILLRDQAYYTYMKGDYDNAVKLSRELITNGKADEQAYQILGSSYRMAKKYNESIEAYGEAIGKYPRSGVLYAELGEAYYEHGQTQQAISVWEKGTKIDPNIGINYYHLAKAYAKEQNSLRSLIDAEIYINMDNKSNRSIEMRKLMIEQYKTIFSNAMYMNRYLSGRNDFERAIAETLKKFDVVMAEGVNAETLASLRGQFIVDWYQQGNDQKFPFALFDRNRMMLKLGIFDAYNRWLFSSNNPDRFRTWARINEGQVNEFTRYFNASSLKFPEGGQNYF